MIPQFECIAILATALDPIGQGRFFILSNR